MGIEIRPTIFISSTVYDFHDLRSALRHWLQDRGFRVLMSEFNDFPKSLDENSYEACLKAIMLADYFLVLVGTRNGGWWDQEARISITRQEFRWARDAFLREGKPLLAAFVRQAVWDVREDRKALQELLRNASNLSKGINPSVAVDLVNHPSRFVDAAEAIFSFLDEIGQVTAMRAAVSGQAPLPPANWLHRFAGFEDIIAGLDVSLKISGDVPRLVMLRNLKDEIAANMAELMIKSKKGGPNVMFASGYQAIGRIDGKLDDSTPFPATELKYLFLSWFMISRVPNRFSRKFIGEALRTGAFLRFDPNKGQFERAPLHSALGELDRLIAQTAFWDTSQKPADPIAFHAKYESAWNTQGEVTVRNLDLAFPCFAFRQLLRIVQLLRAIFRSLHGDSGELEALGRAPIPALPADEGAIQSEITSTEEAGEWMLSASLT